MNLVKASLYASAHTYCTGCYCDLFRVKICVLVLIFTYLSADVEQMFRDLGYKSSY